MSEEQERFGARYGRRLVRVVIDERLLTEMLHLPDGVWVEFVKSSEVTPGIVAFIAGEQFEPVPMGQEVPLATPTVTRLEDGRMFVEFEDAV